MDVFQLFLKFPCLTTKISEWPFQSFTQNFYFSPYFRTIYTFPTISDKHFPLFSFNLRDFANFSWFLLPLFWPLCIYVSCNARTGRLCLLVVQLFALWQCQSKSSIKMEVVICVIYNLCNMALCR